MLEILKYPNEVLKKPAREVDLDKPIDQVKHLAARMVETLDENGGMGLAAPQVGYSLRVIVIKIKSQGQVETIVMVNPTIDVASDEKIVDEEACLSFPGADARVKRSARVSVSWYDLESGERWSRSFFEYDARCVEHEIDHLNGVLMTDRLGPLKSVFLKKFFRKK